jgi:hypothetical protein
MGVMKEDELMMGRMKQTPLAQLLTAARSPQPQTRKKHRQKASEK